MTDPAGPGNPTAPPASSPGRTPSPDGPGPLGLGRAALVIAAILVLFFLPAFAGDSQFLHRDAGRLHHPMKAWLAGEMQRGHFPQWNPWAGFGYPLVSAAVDSVQHPFNALLLLLPFEAAFKAWVLLSLLMAGTGAFFWARQLGLRFGPALLAGLGFTLSGFLVSSTDNLTYLSAVAALPWVLGMAHAWLRSGGPGRLAALGAASAMAASAGDPQSWGIALLTLPLYGSVLARDRGGSWRRGAVRGALAAAACAVAAAPFILPVLAWIPHSTRGEPFDAFEYDRFNLVPMRAAELFVPNLLRDRWMGIWSDLYAAYSGNPDTPVPWVLSEYVGAASLALAVLGAARSRAAGLLLALAGLALWTAMGSYAGFGQLARHLPVLGGFRYWEKAAAGVHLLVPVAAAWGLAALGERRAVRGFLLGTAAAAAALLSAHAAARAFPSALAAAVVRGGHQAHAEVLASNITGGLLHAGLALALLALATLLALGGRFPRLAAGLAVVVVVSDLAVANVRAYVLYPVATATAAGPIPAFLARATGRLLTPFPHWASPLTRLGANNGPHGEQTADVATVFASRSLAPAFNVGVIGNFEAYTGMIPARHQRFRRRVGQLHPLPRVGMWNVRWLVVPGDPQRAKELGLPPPYRVVAVDLELNLALLEVPHRDRTYLARDLESVDRRHAMEFVLDDGSFPTSRSVVEAPLPPGYHPPRGEARIALDEAERVEIEATSDGPALIVLNDIYAEGWDATVDGRPAEILPANYLARGVWVEAGTHRVSFAYRTPMLREGWALFLCGAAALAGSALVAARRRRARPEGPAP